MASDQLKCLSEEINLKKVVLVLSCLVTLIAPCVY